MRNLKITIEYDGTHYCGWQVQNECKKKHLGHKVAKSQGHKVKEIEEYKLSFEEAMDDDFNMPLALSNMFELVSFTNKHIDDPGVVFESKEMLFKLAQVFGLNLRQADEDLPAAKIEALIKGRDEARSKKDYKRSDDIRKKLSGMGVILEDTKEGTVWRKEL